MTARRHWTWGIAIAVAVAGCNRFDRLDSTCTPDEPSIDESEDCIRADGRGPLVAAECKAVQDAPGSDPTWLEVEAVLLETERGNCADGGVCHGEPDGGLSGIHLPPAGGQALYDALASTTGRLGVPYLDTEEPERSWMHCNVRSAQAEGTSVGAPMPYILDGLPDPADALLIEDWILQGAKGPND